MAVNHFVLSWTEPTVSPPTGFSPQKPYSLSAHDGDPDPALYVDDNGNVGIGTNNPTEKLEVNGQINASGIKIANSFLQKELGWHQESANDYSNSCYDSVNDLPAEVRNHGRCLCDVSDSEKDCELADLTSADQPGCYDMYQILLPNYYSNYPNSHCQDLVSDEIQYFQLWSLEEKDKTVQTPFASYNACPSFIIEDDSKDLGDIIAEKLEQTSCFSLFLKTGSYNWENSVTIKPFSQVKIGHYGYAGDSFPT